MHSNNLLFSIVFTLFVLTGSVGSLLAQCYFTLQADTVLPKSCKYAIENVVWRDFVNTSSAQNDIIKIGGGNSWNADARSVNEVYNNGFVQTVVVETNTNRMIGLNNLNSNSSYTDLDYAFYLVNNGGLRIFENGANRGEFGAYKAGDTLRITAFENTVYYVANNKLIYTSSVAPTFPLFVDVSINTVLGTLQDVAVGNGTDSIYSVSSAYPGTTPTYQWQLNGMNVGSNSTSYVNNLVDGDVLQCILTPSLGGCSGTSVVSNTVLIRTLPIDFDINTYAVNDSVQQNTCLYVRENVSWQNIAGLDVTSTNSLQKSVNSNSWNSGAFSYNSIQNGGYAETVINETNTSRMIGLNTINENSSYTDIDYAFYFLNNGDVRVYENGTFMGSWGNYSSGDTFQVAVIENEVRYIQNGNVIYTSTIAPTLPLYVDMSLNTVNSTIENVSIVNKAYGRFFAGITGLANISYQWKLNGTNVGSNSPNYTNTTLMDGDTVYCEYLVSSSLDCGIDTLLNSNYLFVEDKNPKNNLIFSIRNDSIVNQSCYYAYEEVAWQSISGLETTTATNSVIKSGGSSGWNSGAFSYNQVDEGGYMQTIVNENNTSRMIGLNSVNENVSYTDIDYAFYLINNGEIRIYENGLNRGSWGNYNPGDTLRISVLDTTVRYLLNGNIIYTSTISPSLPLFVDMSLNSIGSTAEQIYVNNTAYGLFSTFLSGASNVSYQWKLNGANVGTDNPTYTNTSLVAGDTISCDLALINTIGCSSDTIEISNRILINEQNLADEIIFAIRNDSIVDKSCIYAYEEVGWQSISGIEETSSTNSLEKISGSNGWNAGAFSFNKIEEGGFMQFIASETNTRRMIGLNSVNQNVSYTDIDFAFYLLNNGDIRIYENGSFMGSWGSYDTGDTLSVAIVNNEVRYIQNGNIVYTSTNSPNLPLYVDMSLNDVGATLEQIYVYNTSYGIYTAFVEGINNLSYQWKLNGANVGTDNPIYTNLALSAGDTISCDISLLNTTGCAPDTFLMSNRVVINEQSLVNSVLFSIRNDSLIEHSCLFANEEVSWQSISGLDIVSNNNVYKTSGSNSWNSGGFSFNKVEEGGFMQTIVNETNANRMIGLNSINQNVSYTDIDFAFYLVANQDLRVYENGSNRGSVGSYNSGDTLRIAVIDNEIIYYQNGFPVYTSLVSPTLPLFVDMSLNTVGSSFENITVYNGLYGVFSAFVNGETDIAYQWKLNGANSGIDSSIYSNLSLAGSDIINAELYILGTSGCGADTVVYSNQINIEEVSFEEFTIFNIQHEQTQRDGCQYEIEEITWATINGVETDANNVSKTTGTNSWNSSAFSNNQVRNNGYLQFIATETNTNRMIGLNSINQNSSYTDIDYAFYLNNQNIRVYENGANNGFIGTYNTGDTFRIDVIDNIVYYKLNGTTLFTSGNSPTLPLYVDISFNTVGSTIDSIFIGNPSHGRFIANSINLGDSPIFEWRVNGNPIGGNSTSINVDSIKDNDLIVCVVTPDFQSCSSTEIVSNRIHINDVPPNNLNPVFTPVSTTWLGNNTEWYDSTNWSAGTPFSAYNVIIPNGLGNYPEIPNASHVNQIDINSGASLTLIDSAVLTIYGDLNIDGSLIPNSGELEFRGCLDTSRIVIGNNLNAFDLEINNNLGLIIQNGNLHITGNLNLNSGLILNDTNFIVFEDNSSWNNGWNGSYISQRIRKIGDDAFTFPVGDNGNLQTIGISAPSNVTDVFEAQYFDISPDSVSPVPYYHDSIETPPLDHVSGTEHWILNRVLGSSNVFVSLNWDLSSGGVGVPATLRVARWDGSMWRDEGNGGTSGTLSDGIVMSGSAVSSFSPFTLASTTLANPLPVNIVNFEAELKESEVELRWRTASDKGIMSFVVEKSLNGTKWKEIGTIESRNSITGSHYTSFDYEPILGDNYYKLKMIHDDSKIQYSQVIKINYNPNQIKIYPNPVRDVLLIKNLPEQYQVHLYDAYGRMLLTTRENNLDFKGLPSGIYELLIINKKGEKVSSLKVIH